MNAPRRPPRRNVDGVLLLDKPLGLSSNTALQAARRLFNAAKAGHTGTLDPLATGLLPLCFGEATKFAGELLHADKAYRATVRLGIATDTADAEGAVISQSDMKVSEAELSAVLQHFRGEIEQLPPMYSALKRDGKPLYEYARQGIELERAPRRVTITKLDLLSFDGRDAVVDVDCSKGTYIRTLAADIGATLGCGAHLAMLRRTRVADIMIEQAVTLDAIEALPVSGRDSLLAPLDALVANLPQVQLGSGDSARIRHGQAIPWSGRAGQRLRMFSSDQGFIGIGTVTAAGMLQVQRLVAESRPLDAS
ncbi:MAG: tRNA pseudouridine(55) synthase TruB [Georgfuchsia sp.]